MRPLTLDDGGSSPVEFVLVGSLLTLLTLAVLQLGLAVYVRNVVHDAAVEGAYHAALADVGPAEGAQRARDVITRAVGSSYTGDITATVVDGVAGDEVEVRIRTSLPVIALVGIAGALEVTAHAPKESLGGG